MFSLKKILYNSYSEIVYNILYMIPHNIPWRKLVPSGKICTKGAQLINSPLAAVSRTEEGEDS